MTETPSCILYHYLPVFQVDKMSFQFFRLSKKKISVVSQLHSDNGSIKKWHEFKRDYDQHENSYFQWV